MNLAAMTPAKQVAAVLKGLRPGDMPDIPPFLRVDAAEAARRKKWWDDHPPVPMQFGGGAFGVMDANKRPEAIEYAKRAAERAATVAAAKPGARKPKVESVDTTGFYWDPRRGRFIPDGYVPPKSVRLPPTDEEKRLAAEQHARNAKGAPKKKTAKPAAPAAPAAPAKRERESATNARKVPQPGAKLKDEATLDCFIRLMKRPCGVTLAEASEATGSLQHSLWASVTPLVRKKRGHTVIVNIEDGARIFRIE